MVASEDMEEATFPGYQYSAFSPDELNGQYVVRTDKLEDFEMMVEWVKNKIKIETLQHGMAKPQTAATRPLVTPAAPVDSPLTHCPIHHTLYRVGRGGSKYCPTKMPDNTWCKQKPSAEVPLNQTDRDGVPFYG